MKSIAFLTGLLVIVVLVGGFVLAEAFDSYDPVEEAYAERVRAETAEQIAWQEAARPVKLALYALFGGVGVLALGLGAWAGFLYVHRRATTVYPDSNGVMPAVILRRGEFVVDLGALAGPLVVGPEGPVYRLPAGDVSRMQDTANRGAAMTRTMRAWATRPAAPRREALPWTVLRMDDSGYNLAGPGDTASASPALPPVEVLSGDEAHILRLLEEGER